MNQDDDRYIAAALVGGILLVVAVALGMVLLWAAPARGHSFYDPYCCSGQDCEPISDERVKLVPGGFLLDGRFFIKNDDARQAPDGNYHACFWPTPDALRCFYRPALGA